MSQTRTRYLQHLEAADHDRLRLVEALRSAASIIDGSCPFDEFTQARTAPRLARELRYAAAQLCDHVRQSADGTCRYCEAVIVGAD